MLTAPQRLGTVSPASVGLQHTILKLRCSERTAYAGSKFARCLLVSHYALGSLRISSKSPGAIFQDAQDSSRCNGTRRGSNATRNDYDRRLSHEPNFKNVDFRCRMRLFICALLHAQASAVLEIARPRQTQPKAIRIAPPESPTTDSRGGAVAALTSTSPSRDRTPSSSRTSPKPSTTSGPTTRVILLSVSSQFSRCPASMGGLYSFC